MQSADLSTINTEWILYLTLNGILLAVLVERCVTSDHLCYHIKEM